MNRDGDENRNHENLMKSERCWHPRSTNSSDFWAVGAQSLDFRKKQMIFDSSSPAGLCETQSLRNSLKKLMKHRGNYFSSLEIEFSRVNFGETFNTTRESKEIILMENDLMRERSDSLFFTEMPGIGCCFLGKWLRMRLNWMEVGEGWTAYMIPAYSRNVEKFP